MFTAFITLIKYGDAGSSVFVDVSERVDGDDGDDGEGIKKWSWRFWIIRRRLWQEAS